MSNPIPPQDIHHAPSPWLDLPVQTFILPFWSSSTLLDDAYAPLEASSSFANPNSSGAFKGGLGMIQIVRYRDTPVGPYDELILVPGFFEAPERRKTMVRCTRIYVSQKQTCWNGRFNWNIPKHLAQFTFRTGPKTGALNVEVYAPGVVADTAKVGPFFRASLTPTRWLPSFPFSTGISKYVGMNLDLGQPPLPAGRSTQGNELINVDGPRQRRGSEQLLAENEDADVLCGTKDWKYAAPLIWGKAKLCWAQMDESVGADQKGWWPAYRPWRTGLLLENGFINFEDAVNPPLSRL